jgi:hypothetical protein
MMEIEPSVVIAFLSLLGIIFTAWVGRDKMSKTDALKLEIRLTTIEETIDNKLEPIWNIIISELPKILISPHSPEFDKLMIKTMDNVESLTTEEIDAAIKEIETNHLNSNDERKVLASMFLLSIFRRRQELLKI